MAKRLKKVELPQGLPAARLEYRSHSGTHKRVWNIEWFGDVFEVVTNEEFKTIRKFCGTFGIPLDPASED